MHFHSVANLYFIPYVQLTFVLPHTHQTPLSPTPSSSTIDHLAIETSSGMGQASRQTREARTEEESEYELERRNYKPRTATLCKSFECKVEDCHRKYSSSNALSNHMRLKHDIRKRD
jgi:hypothetical protein